MTDLSNTLFGLRDHPWKPGYLPPDAPLTSFYVPALERSVRYDRIAGFFSSAALSVAAQGIASMIARGGRMRLLVGAQLSQRDVDALLRGVELGDALARQFRGLLTDPAALADHLVRRRLEVLAWLAANDRLRIRVVVEADPQTGVPMVSDGYFHAKSGILHDETGDGIAFSGSINETATAWRGNYESFKVFTSWEDSKYFQGEVETFERLWKDAEIGWRTVDLPKAAREELLTLTPSKQPSSVDPALGGEADAADNANWITQFVRDAPYLVDNGRYVGVETAAVEPFPHQRAVAYDILSRFPFNHLLADEVGLGKTIEAGLILRSLLISGRAKRCLILVPRSLARQWQEELRDRFLIQAPFYDGRQFLWFDQPRDKSEAIPLDTSPWECAPVVIASAQMVKRQERAKELLDAPPWDIVMVDEAHHARRREFGTRRYRPNRLLRLLESLAARTKSLILLTATPMQVNPVEVWDLLRLLGLPDEWSDPDRFIEYFQSTRLPYEDIDWEHIQPMLRASVGRWGWGDYLRDLGAVGTAKLKLAVESPSTRPMRILDAEQRDRVMGLMRTCHPVAYGVHRHTRNLLRQYYERGLITQHIPNRDPQSVWLEMSPDESELYEDVERYISHYYNQYEEERPGLGFVMTIYRRRLTSGLYALGESLKRRKSFLLGQWEGEHPHGLQEEDIEDDDLTSDVSEAIEYPPARFSGEVGEIDRLLRKLERLPSETKLERVLNDIDDELRRADQIIVFTQYTDTMDSLRDHLKPTYGSTLGCYSGRGGEQWDSETMLWRGMSKERLQREFSEGRIKVLVCTDAAAEGLNLQNCGSMFNYDMPWNPMKVEQRIGRIDRIGQLRTEVRIRHFLYRGTVESDVYAALGARIDWFEAVVGDLQPILQVVQKTIRRAAMTLGTEREQHLREGIGELRQDENSSPSPISYWEPAQNPPTVQAPLTIEDLNRLMHADGVWKSLFEPGNENGTFHLGGSGQHLTMDTSVAEADHVTLCSYNTTEFDRLVSLPSPRPRSNILRLERNGEQTTIGFYGWANGDWRRVTSLDGLLSLLDATPPGKMPDAKPAMRMFEESLRSTCHTGVSPH